LDPLIKSHFGQENTGHHRTESAAVTRLKRVSLVSNSALCLIQLFPRFLTRSLSICWSWPPGSCERRGEFSGSAQRPANMPSAEHRLPLPLEPSEEQVLD